MASIIDRPALDTSLSGNLLVGGDRISESSGRTHEHIYPATGQPNATVHLAGAAEIDHAVTSAWNAHREWTSLMPNLPHPADSLVTAEDISNAVLFLASDEVRYITGVALPVDAGSRLK